MSVPVVTAVTDSGWEARLIAALERTPAGVRVVRRCVDVADLLTVAGTATARVALVSADLRRLDADTVVRLAAAGISTVGVAPAGDTDAEARLRRLGADEVVTTDADAVVVAAALGRAAAATPRPPVDYARAAAAGAAAEAPPAPAPSEPGPDGRLIAVWGPTGAPGRTTVAVGVAAEAAALGARTLLVDCDTYGGVVAQVLGLLDESAGLAAAARLATHGSLGGSALAGLALEVSPGLRVLTGVARADRWPELRASAVRAVLALARSLADVVVVDCGFCLEQDEELAFDTAAPRRNGATLAAVAEADEVLAVGAADPVGVHRLVRGLAELRGAAGDVAVRVVLNRVRRGVVEGDPERELGAALQRYAGVAGTAFVPYDRAACDAALAAGRTLAEAAPGSPARRALRALAAEVTGRVDSPPRRRVALARRRGG